MQFYNMKLVENLNPQIALTGFFGLLFWNILSSIIESVQLCFNLFYLPFHSPWVWMLSFGTVRAKDKILKSPPLH